LEQSPTSIYRQRRKLKNYKKKEKNGTCSVGSEVLPESLPKKGRRRSSNLGGVGFGTS